MTNKYYQTRIYRIWSNMKNRCNNKNYRRYNDYGGRGITVCNEWLKFDGFLDWALSNGYSDELTIDRIDNNGNYCPSNCRFVSPKKNSNNKRTNLYFIKDGETHTLKEWSEILGIDYILLYCRIRKRNWSFEKAISVPIQEKYRNGLCGVK